MNAKLHRFPAPRTFTSNERLIDALREEIFRDGRPFAVIATEAKVGKSTIAKLAQGGTRWPRPTTLFPLLAVLGLSIRLHREK